MAFYVMLCIKGLSMGAKSNLKDTKLKNSKLKGQDGIYSSDLESTGLLHQLIEQGDKAKLHNFAAMEIHTGKMYVLHSDTQEQRDSIQRFLDRDIVLVMHSGITYDYHALKHFGYDVSKVTIVDTLALSWYLDLYRPKHGLSEYGEESGTPKPKIDDWENLTQADYDNRVKEDVKIQSYVYNKMKKRFEELYGKMSDIEFCNHKVVKYLNFKMEQLAEQQNNRIKIDVPKTQGLIETLSVELADKVEMLKAVMPKVPKYKQTSKPKKTHKIDGSLSALGEKWDLLTKEHGLPFDYDGVIKTVTKYEEPNPNSSAQVKEWLHSLGWNPLTFKYIKEDDGSERAIEQIYIQGSGGQICGSIEDLAEEVPDVTQLTGMGVLQHRIGVLNGFLDSLIFGQYVEAGAAGFTNTLRLKHRRPFVNIPSSRVLHGESVRSCLVARDGRVLLGSDLSSLENIIKFNFQLPHDKDYVLAQQSDDFDAHLDIALEANLVTEDEVNFYKIEKEGFSSSDYSQTKGLLSLLGMSSEDKYDKIKSIAKIRSVGKQGNYASQYGASGKTVARAAGVSDKIGNTIVKAYRKRNWTIDVIANEQKDKRTSWGRYQLNPLNGIWYNLKNDKDRFSTLVQGTSSYVFDLWLAYQFSILKSKKYDLGDYGLRLLAQAHDEQISELTSGYEGVANNVAQEAIHKVNESMKLPIVFSIDTQFGKNYSEIH